MKFQQGRGSGGIKGLIVLKGGESVTGVLRGDPYEFEHAFKPDQKPKFRFRLNMVVKENGALQAKVLEGGWKLYQNLKELNEAGWDLEKSFTRVSRIGTTMNDTVYSATVMPTPVPAATLAEVAAVPILDLRSSPNSDPSAEPTIVNDPALDNSDLPF